ncbi:MAG: hypothetical protein HYR62_11245 [Actinobacteria bacterium]|nr:hypothetical protein [Actinomycetota bacterium]MBI3686885.1 hypothetical protein [Actinomycetota bacterium]
MTFEAAFMIGYANVLLLIALGLHRLGRVNTSPWSSRALAGHQRRHSDDAPHDGSPPGDMGPDHDLPAWPHGEPRRLHTGIAMIAATAAMVLVVAAMVRHHATAEVLLLTATGVAAGALVARLGNALRTAESLAIHARQRVRRQRH